MIILHSATLAGVLLNLITALEIHALSESSLSSSEKSISGPRIRYLLPSNMSLDDSLGETSKFTEDEISPRQSTTDLIPCPPPQLNEHTTQTSPSKRMLPTLAIAGPGLTIRMIINNVDFIPGTPTLTNRVQTFFMQIVRNVVEKWGSFDRKNSLEVKMGRLTLRMEARGPHGNETVAWTFVSEYATQMLEWAARGFLGFVGGLFQYVCAEGGLATIGVLYMVLPFLDP